MDKDLLLDDIIKEKANSELLSLPMDLDLKIKETVAKLPERGNSKTKILKRIAAACAIVIIGTFGLSAASPTFAFNIPVVNSVFQYLSEKNFVYNDYVRYSSDLNISKTSNGVTFIINSIVYDGITLNIGYTVVSEKELTSFPHLLGSTMKVNGRTIGFGGGGGGSFKDKHTFIGMDEINMDTDYLPKEFKSFILGGNVRIPDEFIMSIKIKDLSNGIKGDWDFKFKVSNEKTKNMIKTAAVNVDLSTVDAGLKVNDIVFTPINTAIRVAGKNNPRTDIDDLQFIAFDDKGRPLGNKSGSGSGNADSVYSEYILRNIYEDTKAVTFIPRVYTKEYFEKRSNTKGFIASENIEVPLNISSPTVISQHKLGAYKITQIEPLNDKTLVYYECSGLLSAISPFNLRISSDDAKENFRFSPENVKELSPGSNRYIAELPLLSQDKKYKLISEDFEKIYEFREDAKFTVNVP